MNAFKRLAPKQKQMVVVGGALTVAMLVIALSVTNEPDNTSRQRSADNSIRHVLTDRDSREVTIGSLATQLTAAQQQNRELREQFQQLRTEVQHSSSAGVSSAVTRELDSLSREIDLLREENRELRERADTLDLSAIAAMQAASDTRRPVPSDADEPPPADERVRDPASEPATLTPPESAAMFEPLGDQDISGAAIFEQRPVTRRAAPSADTDAQPDDEAPAPRLSITTFYQEDHPDRRPEAAPETVAYLPSGSIISGTLLNGLDAPTGQGARRDPFPVTVRIQHDAILPNRFSADVKECFMLLSGHGDLSTERAFLRGNNISCLTDDGDVIETELRGYAVGEDGKAGLRGRLVSKQGALIARSMVAGFFSGASQAFNVSPIPVINTTSDDGRTQYQSNFNSDLLQGAGAQGASQALDRVAQFYVDMAESIFPVVEIDVGRSIDVILTQGLSMQADPSLTQLEQ